MNTVQSFLRSAATDAGGRIRATTAAAATAATATRTLPLPSSSMTSTSLHFFALSGPHPAHARPQIWCAHMSLPSVRSSIRRIHADADQTQAINANNTDDNTPAATSSGNTKSDKIKSQSLANHTPAATKSVTKDKRSGKTFASAVAANPTIETTTVMIRSPCPLMKPAAGTAMVFPRKVRPAILLPLLEKRECKL